MYKLYGTTLLFAGIIIFWAGVLVGVRCEEINLGRRERRLAEERRLLNAQARAVGAQQAVNQLIWEARHHLRREFLWKYGLPLIADPEEDEDDA